MNIYHFASFFLSISLSLVGKKKWRENWWIFWRGKAIRCALWIWIILFILCEWFSAAFSAYAIGLCLSIQNSRAHFFNLSLTFKGKYILIFSTSYPFIFARNKRLFPVGNKWSNTEQRFMFLGNTLISYKWMSRTLHIILAKSMLCANSCLLLVLVLEENCPKRPSNG